MSRGRSEGGGRRGGKSGRGDAPRGARPASGKRGPSPAASGKRGSRPAAAGKRGPGPAAGGKRGPGPAPGRDRTPRPAASGDRRLRPSASPDRGPRPTADGGDRPAGAGGRAGGRQAGQRPTAGERPGPPARRMVVYGRNPVREALRGRRKVHRVWATRQAAAEGWDPAPVSVVDVEEVEERAGSDAHQGVCALVDPYPYADAAELLATPDAWLVALDEVTDPQNLGAVCRTAEAVGATGVVIPERRSAEVTPAVCKASAGAVEHLPVARVRNLADFFVEAKDRGCWVYGAAAEAAMAYDRPDYTGPVVVVLGAEGRGLRPRVVAMCDELVALPLRGRVASLNVSATAAVLLYEMLQQRLDAST